jgi:hypothetical protein
MSRSVFRSSSSPSAPASGKNNGLEVAAKESHRASVDMFRIAIPGGAKLSMTLAVVNDSGTSSGGGKDVRKMSAAAAVKGAMVVSVAM